MLKWIFQRVTGQADAMTTPIGRLPKPSDVDLTGLDLPKSNLDELLRVDTDGWLAEVPLIKEHYARFGAHLPPALNEELAELEKRLKS